MNAKSLNDNLVLIEPLEIEEGGKVQLDEQSREALMKRQNKGVVLQVGDGVKWPDVGWTVSYFKGAATPIDAEGKEYMLLNKVHVLIQW